MNSLVYWVMILNKTANAYKLMFVSELALKIKQYKLSIKTGLLKTPLIFIIVHHVIIFIVLPKILQQ
jgi:DNA phosphorothioation-dependent restriction protein DptG